MGVHDRRVRDAFHRDYLTVYHEDAHTLVVDEFGVDHGRCRADIAIINGRMEAFEIKTAADTLGRLPHQIAKFDEVFDRCWIVVAPQHHAAAVKLLPVPWGVITTEEMTGGDVQFSIFRMAAENSAVSAVALAGLLWRTEVQEILAARGRRVGELRGRRAELYRMLVDGTSNLDELRALVRNRIKARQNWRDRAQRTPNGGLFRPNAKS